MRRLCLLGCCFFLVIASCGRYGFEEPDSLDAGTQTPWAALGPEHWPATE